MDLTQKKCLPCEGGVPKLTARESEKLLPLVSGWEIQDEKLHKRFKFSNFVQAMKFINQVADIAEAENHHPDFSVHYNRVEFTIWTHAIDGLSENDFILAAKIDALI